MKHLLICLLPSLFLLSACGPDARLNVQEGMGPDPTLPEPQSGLIPTINIAKANRWPEGRMPSAAAGTRVNAFADGLDHPRWLLVLPNDDVLVAESNAPADSGGNSGIKGWVQKKVMTRAGAGVPSADRITLLRDTDGDGVADFRSVLLDDLYSPFGMALVNDKLYVANADAVLAFPFEPGQTEIAEAGETLVELPGGPLNHHWTKNIIAGSDGQFLYAAVGSNSNIAENGLSAEEGRAAIWKINLETGAHEIYADGLRNPVGMSWVPEVGRLWVVVNERDALGGDLVPDYMTSVQEGGFYGWPWSYYGQHVDERVQPRKPEMVEKAIKPDYALGPHTASLGLTYSSENSLPDALQTGMFVGQHGSWNRDPRSGYKVIFVPFENGKPTGLPVDVLSGFIDEERDEANGRPVGVVLDNGGALLVADDVGNVIWRVSAEATP